MRNERFATPRSKKYLSKTTIFLAISGLDVFILRIARTGKGSFGTPPSLLNTTWAQHGDNVQTWSDFITATISIYDYSRFSRSILNIIYQWDRLTLHRPFSYRFNSRQATSDRSRVLALTSFGWEGLCWWSNWCGKHDAFLDLQHR